MSFSEPVKIGGLRGNNVVAEQVWEPIKIINMIETPAESLQNAFEIIETIHEHLSPNGN